ncbi:MAG: hypothetical protein ACHQFW_10590 [Chitinophagales bacterium]
MTGILKILKRHILKNSVVGTGLILILFFTSSSLCAQETKGEGRLMEEDILENAAEKIDNTNLSVDTYQENLNNLILNPININTATATELRNTTLFTELQIRDLRRHIEAFGPLTSIYELQTIQSFSTEDIINIKPFISLTSSARSSVPFLEQLYAGDYQYFLRFGRYVETQEGFVEDSLGVAPYYGNNLRIYTRLRYNYQNSISYGVTAEKDAGEAIFGPSQPAGFDYYSAHFFKKGTGRMKALALGDYELRMGQGLIMWSGFGFGKSVYPVAVRRAGPVLDGYTSTNENRFMRGAGITYAFDNVYVTAFASNKKIDANASLIDTTDEEILELSNLDDSGLHRTESELEKKDVARETTAGFDITLYKGQFNIGLSSVYFHLNTPLVTNKDAYEIYDFSGQNLLNTSIHYNYLWRNILIFGETAMSDNLKGATLNGIIMPVDPKVDIAIVHRYFSPQFQTLYAETFSESTFPQNEQGTYFGTEIKPVRGWKISGYLDLYKHPWLEYQTDGPSYGTDFFTQLTWQPSRAFETYIRYKREISDRNASSSYFEEPLVLNLLVRQEKSSIRWHADYDVNKSLTLKSRIEFSFYDEHIGFPEKGYLLFQDFNYHPMSSPFGFATRFAIFNTDSYNTRIYAYETEVLYAYSIVGLSGEGTRAYLLVTYSPYKWLDIWARVSNTWYTESEDIGSGYNAFPGNTRSDVKLQMRLKW